ncbi:MAG TPA: hypothetical protein VNB78_03735 [Sphingomicrobium sp.]|jgi:hypothetical protein|nr:hypothetical protein [Sphingomicrobium sp.]
MSVAIIALALAAAAAEEHGPYCEVQGDKLVPTGQVSAEKMDWYNSDKPVVFSKKKYIKYGMPQIMGIDDLQYWQTKDKVPVMLKAGGNYRDIIYVQSSTTLCEFQPYRIVK